MSIHIKNFQDLSNTELYQILQLREEVFTLEQNCAEEDLDGKDLKTTHFFIKEEERVIAYGRFFKPDHKGTHIGRFLVKKEFRGKGHAQKLFQAIVDYAEMYFPGSDMLLSSQCYIQHFYQQYGFESYGETYDEGGIDHIKMIRPSRINLTKSA